jgi:para-nitrobenzyl esterase
MLRIVYVLLWLVACSRRQPQQLAQPASDAQATINASIEGGVIQGLVADDVMVFKGIPYAAPPVGHLRWRPPQPVVAWTGVRKAYHYGHDCVQSVLPGDAAASGATQDEDCLVLNVWAPHDGSVRPHPVLVWLHGGGFLNGAASVPFFDGSSFAREGVVVVIPNYRLGRMGFFAHPALTAEGERPLANYGLLDQLAALQWVQKNIAALGGDPAQVTIAGNSAGGISVIHLMTWPAARGLFQRAAVLSGGGRSYIVQQRELSHARGTLSSAEQCGVDFARSVGIRGLDAAALARLRALPAKTINGSMSMMALLTRPRTYAGGPIVDGATVTEQPEVHIRKGNIARVPLIIGTTSGDLSNFFLRDVKEPLAIFGDAAERARRLYEVEGLLPRMQQAAMISADMNMHEPARFVARELTARGVPVWLYRYDYVADSHREAERRAAHASELPFLFNQLDARFGRMTTDRDRAMAGTFHRFFVNFAKTGDPNGAGLTRWPAFDASRYDVMMFRRDGTVSIQSDPLRERLALIEAQR